MSLIGFLILVLLNKRYPRPNLKDMKPSGPFKVGHVESRYKGLIVSVFYPTFAKEQPHDWLYYGEKSLKAFTRGDPNSKRKKGFSPTFLRHLLNTKFYAAPRAPIAFS